MSRPQPTMRGAIARQWMVLGLLLAGLAALAVRDIYLQIIDHAFLQAQGDSRYLRTVRVAPMRGMILDRNGEPLAVSTPVESIWAYPPVFADSRTQWPVLAGDLGMRTGQFETLLAGHREREFMYLRRQLRPADARKVMALNVAGVHQRREYRRYYPAGPVLGHVLGFTNVDDQGQEGLELTLNKKLAGETGLKRVMQDRLGRVVENVESIRPVHDGENVRLTIDARIQYLAFRYLARAVRENRASGGSAVVLDARSGEVLAMVNQPAFNPNDRSQLKSSRFRNRAVTDVFEPGSTMKPLTIGMALTSGRMTTATPIDTEPGYLRLNRRTIHDTHDYGLIDVARVIVKSSNVGAAKIALHFPVASLLKVFHEVGFGGLTGVSLPGEVPGHVPHHKKWRDIEHATLAYGYGLSVSLLQLAHAYTVFATDGRLLPVSIVKHGPAGEGTRVFSADVAAALRPVLERVTSAEGTARHAKVPQYTTAGKTGTVRKLGADGRYDQHRYQAIFVGFAPATRPRFVMAVMVDEPRGKTYYGGTVAAPVFANVMAGALRLYNVAPDRPQSEPAQQLVARFARETR